MQTANTLYSEGYNFVVVADSLLLQAEEPLITLTDTTLLRLDEGQALVVMSRETITTDSTSQVWVRVAHDAETIGWVPEEQLLESVVPDNPISMAIHTFSHYYRPAFAVCLLCIALLFFVSRLFSHFRLRMVHLRDVPSAYPTLLCIAVATAATLYGHLQHTQLWQQFYYSPSLNPFGQPLLMGIFMALVWSQLLLGLAAIDEVYRHLRADRAMRYLAATLGFIMMLFLLFVHLPTRVALPLLVVYSVWAIYSYIRHARPTCRCGRCGTPMHTISAPCPNCGAVNREA